jgi:hypothetical protein
MKKLLIFSLILISVCSCKKNKFSPEGPTDVRIENMSDQEWLEVIVNTSGGKDTFNTIAAGGTSEYSRFEKAFPKAEITAMIGGVKYSTGTVNYIYLTYIGQAKITYQVFIKSVPNRTLEIFNCSLDAPLD